MSNRTLGLSLMALAILHQVVGLLAFLQPLKDAIALGWWASQDRDEPLRAVMFWFFFFGFLLALWGESIRHRTDPLRRAEWGGGVVLSLLGGMAIPPSGFWAVMVLCLVYGYRQRSRRLGVSL